MDLQVEKKIWAKDLKVAVGLDEAGRGPLAGPVVAGAVAVDYFLFKKADPVQKKELSYILKQVNDSKKLTSKKREELYGLLVKSRFIKWGIGAVSEKIIDRINIFEASRLAMAKACFSLNQKIKNKKLKICYLIIDGNFLLPAEVLAKAGIARIGQKSIIKGDQKVFSIAAASILAKVYRDRIMQKADKKYPQYGFARHKGYPTKHHRKMLEVFGPALIHRKSFRPVCFYSKINQIK
jgi:ribonuclease HII